MNGERKAVLFTVSLIVFCITVIAVLVFSSLWPDRQLVAWILLGVFGSLALVSIASKVNEMNIRHKRYHHHKETPLDENGDPAYMPVGSQVYQRQTTQPKESYLYEYEREPDRFDRARTSGRPHIF